MNLIEIALTGYPNDFMQKLAELYQYEEDCDTNITCSNGILKGHSLVLRIALPFWRILEQRQCERILSVKFTRECMQNLLDLIYTGKTKISPEIRNEVIEAVRYFQLPGVNLEALETKYKEKIKEHESVVTSSQPSLTPKKSHLRKNPFAGTHVLSETILMSNDHSKSVDLTNSDSSGSATPEDLIVPVADKVNQTVEHSDSENSIILVDTPIPCYKVLDSSLENTHNRPTNTKKEGEPSTSKAVCADTHSSEKKKTTEEPNLKRSNPFANFPSSDEGETDDDTLSNNKRTRRPRAVKKMIESDNDDSFDSEDSDKNNDFIARTSFTEMHNFCVVCHKHFSDIKKHIRIHKLIIRKKTICEKCEKIFNHKAFLIHHKCEKKSIVQI